MRRSVVGLLLAITPALFAAAPAATPTPLVGPTPDPEHIHMVIDDTRFVRFEGEVNEKGADQFITDINALDAADQVRPIYIVINSPGGSLDAGFRMENNLDAIRAPTVCLVDPAAESMASGIFLHCKERYMRLHAGLLFHWGSIHIDRSRPEAESLFKHAMKQFDEFDQDNADHLKMSLAAYRAKIDHDWRLTAGQALQAKIIDGIVDDVKVPAPTPTPTPEDIDIFKLFEK